MSDLTGQSIGRYHIIERLGEGGMAIVYKAYDTRLECDVAIKFIRTEKLAAETSTKTLNRFKVEAQKMAQMTFPNITSVTDYGDYNGAPYLVMKYLAGGSLKQKLGKPMPYFEAARLLAPVAHALEYAHARGVIHRDVKPANILLTESGQPMLSDFGIAKILALDEAAEVTGTGVGIGTPEYMSPEQALGRSIDGRTDIYSLGLVFYELVTGRKPFHADTPMAVIVKQIHDPLPRPKDFVRELPDSVERIIFKALAKKPEDRYANMGIFAAELENLAKENKKRGNLDQPIKNRAQDVTDTQDILLSDKPKTFLSEAQANANSKKQNSNVEVEVKPEQLTCSCGNVIQKDEIYCQKCGKQVLPDRSCPYCGKNTPANSIYCRKCGKNIGGLA